MDPKHISPGLSAASSRTEQPDPILGQAVRRGLSRPVDHLKRSMRELTRSFDTSDPRSADLDAVLQLVERLGRNVRDLFDYAHPPEPRELECTIDEVLYTARYLVPHHMWKHLLVARERDLPAMHVDGPVLSRSIARLVEAAAPLARKGVLLNVFREDDATVFTITFHGRSAYLGDPMGLCHSIAWRDLAVIGCEPVERTSDHDDTTIRIRVPDVGAEAGGMEERAA